MELVALVAALIGEEARRRREGRVDAKIPMRPDHGHPIADDLARTRINPGYSLIG
jgi:mannonate dehydratase